MTTTVTTTTGVDVDLSAIRALMICHLDNAGISRIKVVPGRKVASAAAKGATTSVSLGVLLAIDDHVNSTPEIDPTIGDLRSVPDMGAVAMLDPEAGLAWAPADLYGLDGEVHPACQRSLLRRVSADAAARGYEFVVGMELEFTLFRGTKDAPELAHVGPGYGTLPFLELERWHLDVLTALEIAGVPAEQLHPEYENGQMELSLAPRAPVRAIDDYHLARLVITRVALAHGFLVSFAPVPLVGSVSNGCHLHLSAVAGGRNIFFDETTPNGFSDDAGHMIAGILQRLDEGVVLLGGTTLSFERLRPHNWAGAYVCWGAGNREAAVRYMGGFSGFGAEQCNIEVKCVDPAANHYLAAAMLIASAMDGLRTRRALPKEVRVEPGALTSSEAREAEARAFPDTLGGALALFESSRFFEDLLGTLLFRAYIAVRAHDWQTFGELAKEEVADSVRWRF